MGLSSILLYTSLFVSLFFEVFMLITFFEVREGLKRERTSDESPTHFPSVTVIVPCFNEESTVQATIHSLLALDYPKDRLKLMIVDDGSTDGTQKVLKEFSKNPQIQTFKKENGGKHTALNLALKHVTTDLVGCLDADSFVDSRALRRIVTQFSDPEIMAVTPAVRIHEPKTLLQHIQKVEYTWGVLFRRLLASIDGLYVTPGPFSIFRVEVFQKLGGYRHAHHTEDLELAMRLQKNGYKITNALGAYVYTVGPEKLKGLYKQRVRWTYGFLNNAIDYREMFFNPKFGNIGVFVLPVATLSVFTTLYAFGRLLWSMLNRIGNEIIKFQAVGFQWQAPGFHPTLDWFTFTMSTTFVLTMTGVLLGITILAFAIQTVEGRFTLSRGVFYYLTLYFLIVPLWLAKATYSTLSRKSISWR
jgi:poly-beta-1,6-N-acetyl-D-glucosamine synthase